MSNFQKGLIISLIAFFFLGGILFVTRLLMADAFSKEEAQHALYSLWLYKDIRVLDWGAFWYDTNRQVFWPFFHSWIGVLFFLIFGVNFFAARFMSFLFFAATLLLMYLACARFSEKSGWKIGILAVLMALTSPLMLKFSVANSLESLGALIFMATFYLYSIYEERKLTSEYAMLAVLLGLSIYTNYLYAYLILPAFIVMTLGKLGPLFYEVNTLKQKGEKAAYPFVWWAYRKLIILLVLAFFVAGWFFSNTFSRKILLLLQAIFRYSGGEQVGGVWNNLIFYPKAIIHSYAFSPWLGSLILLSIFFPFLGLKFRHFGKLYTFIWTALILTTLTIPTKAPQFIYLIAPFLFIVFSISVVYALEKLDNVKAKTALLIVLFLPALLSLPRLVSLYRPERSGENMGTVLRYFEQGVLPRYPVAAAINLQHLNPEGISFYLWGWNAPLLTDPAIGTDELFRSGKYFLTVTLDSSSPYQAEVLDDSIYLWNVFLADKLRLGEIREFSARRFEKMGLTATIYEKVAAL
jgi:4-amino-4-deoxy-L-arabinose transferase-like glycosyltransferase